MMKSLRVILLLRKGGGLSEVRDWRFALKDEYLKDTIQRWKSQGWDVEVYDSIPFEFES